MLHESSVFDCAVCGLSSAEVAFFGVRECQHCLCGVCAVKLAVFSVDEGSEYDYSKCVICKHAGTKIIISSTMRPFDDYNEKDMFNVERYGLFLDGPQAQKFYKNVVKIECNTCHHQFVSMSALADHVDIHNQRYCDLCVDFKKCLPSEFCSMNDSDFHYHNTKEHPKCTFCNKRFYDNAHLIKHVKERHFLCDICNRRQGFVAYSTQVELLKHFQNDHYMCDICRSINALNVFESEYALKTHKVLEHDNKGLVAEGLVNVNYGDSNGRYGPRRRVRENEDIFTNDLSTVSNQDIPEIMCEEAFPRLNSEQVQQSRQLGSMSVTNDENDARRAFNRPNDPQNDSGNSKTRSSTKEAVPKNSPYDARRNLSNLNSSDFPSLSSEGKVSSNQGREYNKVKSVPTSNSGGCKKPNLDEEYPALSTRSVPITSTNNWKPTGSSNYKPAVKPPPQRSKPSTRVRSPSPPEVKMEIERDIANRPKIQIISREDITKAQMRNDITIKQRLPQDEDFPTLGNVNKNSVGSTPSMWGQNTIMTEKPKIKKQNSSKQEKFAASPLDFPELPFSPKPIESVNSNKKNMIKQKSKQNFVDAASSANGSNLKSKVYSLKSLGEQFQKEVITKPQSEHFYEAQKPSASMRGIDYVPYVVPTNENVVLVDSKMFADLKLSKGNNTKNEVAMKLKVQESAPSLSYNNHYDILLNTNEMTDADNKPKSTPQNKFKTSSYADFPTLPLNSKSADKFKPTPTLKKMDNFADVAASQDVDNVHPKIYSLKTLGEQFQKPPVKLEADLTEITVPVYSPVPSTSLRGIDYVPYIEPRNETVTLVDSKKFSDIKNSSSVETQQLTTKNIMNENNQPSNFTVENTSDFPELPMKPKLSGNPKSNINSKKKDNFSSKVARVNEAKNAEESIHKPVLVKIEPDRTETTTPLYTLTPSASLRGIDYLPCVDPRNESVVLLDSQKFADLKRQDSHDAVISDNSFEVIQKPKIIAYNAPQLSSSTDFPSLEPPKVTDYVMPQIPHKKAEIQRKVASTPVVSLMDVAASVTNKSYTPYLDADERNQRLFDVVNNSEVLDAELAHKFLLLSGCYRNRKTSVQDYLDSINFTFVDHMSFIAELLPQMLVLLPDISLQKCLLSHIPQPWTQALKECNKCGQIINKTDTDHHNLAAHC